jgi:hypothetical protein
MNRKLTDTDITSRLAEIEAFRRQGSTTRLEHNERAALEELQARRANDLTAPEVDDLRAILRAAVQDKAIMCGPERIDMFRNIIRANTPAPADIEVTGGATGLRITNDTPPTRIGTMTVSGPGSVGIDLGDDEP